MAISLLTMLASNAHDSHPEVGKRRPVAVVEVILLELDWAPLPVAPPRRRK